MTITSFLNANQEDLIFNLDKWDLKNCRITKSGEIVMNGQNINECESCTIETVRKIIIRELIISSNFNIIDSNVVFENCTFLLLDPMMFRSVRSSIRAINCKFVSNNDITANKASLRISIESSNCDFFRCEFISCLFNAKDHSTLNIDYSKFTGYESSILIEESSAAFFMGCSFLESDGAIKGSKSSIILDKCEFYRLHGYAIIADSSKIDIGESSFDGCFCFCKSKSEISINQSLFFNNDVIALYVTDSKALLHNVSFSNNTISINAKNSLINSCNCSYLNNIDNGYQGSAISSFDSIIELEKCELKAAGKYNISCYGQSLIKISHSSVGNAFENELLLDEKSICELSFCIVYYNNRCISAHEKSKINAYKSVFIQHNGLEYPQIIYGYIKTPNGVPESILEPPQCYNRFQKCEYLSL